MLVDQGQFSIKIVDQLIYLYSQAIEYYESVDPVKYKSFYDRLQKFLVRPEVFDVMKVSKARKPRKKENSEPEVKKSDQPKWNHPKTCKADAARKRKELDMGILAMKETLAQSKPA